MNFPDPKIYYEHYNNLFENCADYVGLHARNCPGEDALIEHNTDTTVSWKEFNLSVNAFAARLLAAGLKKGDVIATTLPMLKEHVYLMYACFRTGIIIAPLDLRLKTDEIAYCLDRIRPRAYFFLGNTPVMDFRPMISEVMGRTSSVEIWVQFQEEKDQVIEGAVGIADFVKSIKRDYIVSLITGSVRRARRKVEKRDPCLIIFTTGSTGSPKPALLCHEGILVQNIGLSVSWGLLDEDIQLVNLPPSHVAGVTEQLMTAVYKGCASVLLHVFDPRLTLEAIQKHRSSGLGQIPALFNMEWALPDYDSFDLSSLRFIMYGGQGVPKEFLVRMTGMCKDIGTGIGLTESSGFSTFTRLGASVDEIAKSIGFDTPLCPISIREPMLPDGSAGPEKAPGEIGEICFSGPQIFLGYLNDPENTAKTISCDGLLYTGDLGSYDHEGLHLAGRSKMVIKPKGYQVFPGDIENHISEKLKGKVKLAAVVGAEHNMFTEAIVAFVEPFENMEVTPEMVMEACADISAYSRPSHVEIVKPDAIPLNRVAKTDYLMLKELAADLVKELRANGKWDADK